MRRGDIVLVVAPGDDGKARPSVVVQSNRLAESGGIIVCLVTGTIRDAPAFRITVEATSGTGLLQRSQIMVDKIHTVPRAKIGPSLGRLSDDEQIAVNRSLMLFLGLA